MAPCEDPPGVAWLARAWLDVATWLGAAWLLLAVWLSGPSWLELAAWLGLSWLLGGWLGPKWTEVGGLGPCVNTYVLGNVIVSSNVMHNYNITLDEVDLFLLALGSASCYLYASLLIFCFGPFYMSIYLFTSFRGFRTPPGIMIIFST